jgi:hypothetical protein
MIRIDRCATQTTANVLDLTWQSAAARRQRSYDMSIMMPAADQAILARRAEIVAALRAIVPGEGVIDNADQLRVYETDGLNAYRQPPMVAVLPDTTEQVS